MREAYHRGYRVFDFEDDNLTLPRERIMTLCHGIRDAFPSGQIRLLAMNGISYWALDRELMASMKEAGFRSLNLSLVSCDEPLLLEMGRPHHAAKFLQAVRDAFSLGLDLIGYQILGLPGDSVDSMAKTTAFLARLPLRIGASLFYLSPGSPIANSFPPRTEKDAFLARSTAMAIETDGFGREDLYTFFITARILNFLKTIPQASSKIPLTEALRRAKQSGGRSAVGAALLERLFREGTLSAWTRQGLRPLSRFRGELFLRVMDEIEAVCTLKGSSILLKGHRGRRGKSPVRTRPGA
jgi:radical SAM superfamily enzyme YgiQ (UPF0313 family)